MRIQSIALAVLLTLCATLFSPVLARAQQAEMAIFAKPAAALRSVPSKYARRIGALPYGTRVTVLEIKENWAAVRAPSGATGWVPARFVRPASSLAAAPALVTLDAPAPQPAAQPPAARAPLAPRATAVAASEEVRAPPPLQAQAIHPGAAARAIAARGRALGNRPNVFSMIGDSLTANQPFMRGFGKGEYNLGAHTDLNPVLGYFSASPREGVPNSFVNKSAAVTTAFNAAAAFDPSWTHWTDPEHLCQPDESPVLCEFRLSKPGSVIILLGPEDMQVYDTTTYRTYLARLVKTAIDSGVIPVLSTFPATSDNPKLQLAAPFNDVVRQIAAQYRVPWIELRDNAMALRDNGVKSDGFHLSDYGPAYGFDSEPAQWSGCTLRNFLTLQMLNHLRRDVFEVPAP